jgi:hypothetical protein
LRFTIENVLFDGEVGFVDGRCCEGDIQIGDLFKVVLGHDRRWDSTAKDFVPVDPGPPREVMLRVVSIESYRHHLGSLPRGMTARLGLTGGGLRSLQVGMILGSDETGE